MTQVLKLLPILFAFYVYSNSNLIKCPKETYPHEAENSTCVQPKIYEMKVETNVSNRYARTLITSKVENVGNHAQEVIFFVVTPEQAFITGFVMEIDGKSYEAYVQEKERAKNTYQKAVNNGRGAAQVAVNPRDSNRFTVSVNVEPNKKASFYLTYEELLKRENEKYEIVINLNPGQPVKVLEVQVNINETRQLKFVKVPSLRSGNEVSKDENATDPKARVKFINLKSANVKFCPNIQKQKEFAENLGGNGENGFTGQFVVQYDVKRDSQGGEVLVDGGHFVHFYAPTDLEPLPKQVVFVLDTSGSMEGLKITQMKEAMNSILSQLRHSDAFSLVEFNTNVKVWNVVKVKVQHIFDTEDAPAQQSKSVELPSCYEATEMNVEKAKKVIQKLSAYGGTDIDAALRVGLTVASKRTREHKKRQPMVVFLTDGEPTSGEMNLDTIVSTVTESNTDQIPIFSLSFGDDADRNFLRKISLKNRGFNRHIYVAADASLQLEGFFALIASPLLTNVNFAYADNLTSQVTSQQFPIVFAGTEISVAGVFDDADFTPGNVIASTQNGTMTIQSQVYQSVGHLERHWAFLTVKQILEQRELAEDKSGPTQEALRLALKYSFVTDVTSLVVVKPDETVITNTEEDKWRIDEEDDNVLTSLSMPSFDSLDASFNANYFYMETNHTIIQFRAKNQKPKWLEDLYLNANGFVLVSNKGRFSLGINETVTSFPECGNVAGKSSNIGSCRLIHDCASVFHILTDIETYVEFFCELNGFAGVCCPSEAA